MPCPCFRNLTEGSQAGGTVGGEAKVQREGTDFQIITQLLVTELGPKLAPGLHYPTSEMIKTCKIKCACRPRTSARVCNSTEQKSMVVQNLCDLVQVTSPL